MPPAQTKAALDEATALYWAAVKDKSDTVAELREVSWIGSGGTAHWSCCMPWQPAFIAVLVNLVPSCMLPMYVAHVFNAVVWFYQR